MNLPRNAHLWLPSYLHGRWKRRFSPGAPKRLWVALTDHYEPMGGGVSLERGHARVAAWQERWPGIAAAAPVDAEGRSPCYTLFYPQEEYQSTILDALAELTRLGSADVEVHLHHFNDTAASFTGKVRTFVRRLHEDHGLLHRHNGALVFGFIHGNWALDNSHPTGFGCGVAGELQLLRDLGCYADFTMPSLPSPTQSRIVNQIYWTTGDPALPRGFDHGVEATARGGRQGDLLMITGPTGVRLRDRLVPRLEGGELAAYDLPTAYRVRRWIDLSPRIGNDIFLKLYGHSAREDNATALLGTGSQAGALADMFRWIAEEAQAQNLELHWASAFRMFRAVEGLLLPGGGSVLPSPAGETAG